MSSSQPWRQLLLRERKGQVELRVELAEPLEQPQVTPEERAQEPAPEQGRARGQELVTLAHLVRQEQPARAQEPPLLATRVWARAVPRARARRERTVMTS